MSAIVFNYKNAKVKDDSGKIYFTYEDLLKLPEWPEGPLIEIIRGDLFMVPLPKIRHQEISKLLYDTMKPKIADGKIYYAPVDVVLSDENTVIPDLIYIREENSEIIKENNIEGIPDLIIEITSSNRKTDLEDKLDLYEDFGVHEYIIIDTKEEKVHQCIHKKSKFFVSILEPGDILLFDTIQNAEIEVSTIFTIK